METTMNPISSPSIGVERELTRVHEHLRQVTVQVRSGRGGGSGVIWRSDGLIVTNAHVATRSRQSVVLADGRTLEAQVAGRDPRRDLAALKIDARGLGAAEGRDPFALWRGEFCWAKGCPMGSRG